MAKICSHYVASKMELSKRDNRTSYRLRIYESHIFELRIKTWMKVILAVMHTTWAVVKIRPEKKIQALYRYRRGHGFKSRTRLNFFFRPYFQYCSSSVHYCEDHFHSQEPVINNFPIHSPCTYVILKFPYWAWFYIAGKSCNSMDLELLVRWYSVTYLSSF